ncbi:MAG: rhodanese-like domain-containing protein [Syntrophales bacterium]
MVMTLRWLWKGLLLSLSIVFLNHLTAPAVFPAPAVDDVPKITVQELKARIDKGEDLVIVDVRTGNDYEASKIKIKGAVRIPIVQIEERYRELPKDKQIILYCT